MKTGMHGGKPEESERPEVSCLQDYPAFVGVPRLCWCSPAFVGILHLLNLKPLISTLAFAGVLQADRELLLVSEVIL